MNFSEREHEIIKYWENQKIFEKSLCKESPKGQFVFYDGPPFATGLPHYGHIVANVMKDVVPRYFTMRGFHVDRVWGWDCHGLPIENIIEKKLNLASKKEIEEYGVANFNDQCRAEVLRYAEEWKVVIKRLGRWVDMENSYKTMDLSYMESIWWVFKSLWDKGLIYEGHKPMHICPRCETALSNFEVNQGYQDVSDISVFATLPLTSGAYEGANLIIWTTTAWTLPGNALVAVRDDLDYVLALYDGKKYIVLKDRVGFVFEGKDFTLEKTLKGSELVGATYKPLFDFYAGHAGAFRVVSAPFVTTEDGTGIVHIAPGFGEDDYELGKQEGVAPIFHVELNGCFVPEVAGALESEGYRVKDVPVRKKENPQEVDVEILKALFARERLFGKGKVTHSYPFCWRCDTPLLNYATSSWFVRVAQMRDELLKTNNEIHWVPDNMKEGRFGKWLEGARDWAVSRSRFWGTPLPIWKSQDGDALCVGSVEELARLSGREVTDSHKHIIDGFVIEKDGKIYHRIPEVLDCWFESGSMPYAQIHYPFENREKFENGFPAEFIAEGQDQTRGWFYTLHVLANALFGKPAFKNVIVNGIVLAADGKKMSKRLNNYPDPMEVMERYGSDAVRYYLMSSPVVQAENLNFSEKEVGEVSRQFINILMNVVSFYRLYRDHDKCELVLDHVLDRWIFARLHETLKTQTQAMDAYDLQGASRVLQSFVTDLSTWYVRRSRDRMKNEGADRAQALATLRVVLETLAKMSAPFTPFLAEMIFQDVGRATSVHLEDWPTVEESKIDTGLLEEMGRVRSVVSRALERRNEAGINVRQVLGSMTVTVPDGEMSEEMLALVRDEVNVKNISVQKGEYAVELDLTLTSELVREGTVREIIRRVNEMRKEAGLTIEDRIALFVSGEEEVMKAVAEHEGVLHKGTLAAKTKHEIPVNQQTFRINELDITVGFDKM
jgi:isoleucyl-tRNA synthetase